MLALKSNPALQQKWLKIVLHVIDTVLIGLGFAMVSQVDMALLQRMVNREIGWARSLYWPWNCSHQAREDYSD